MISFDGVQRDTLGAVNLVIQLGPAKFSAQFQVLDIDTSSNLILGRPFIHMAGVTPSTLHQMMKLIWKNEELVINDEGSNLGRKSQTIDEISRCTDFYMVELVNAIGEDLSPQIPMPGFGLG